MRSARWFFAFLPFLAAAVLAAETEGFNVLMLYGEPRLLPAVMAFDGALQQEVKQETTSRLTIFSEHFDVAHFPDADYEQIMLDYLRAKYARHRPSVLLVVGGRAYVWLARHRQLFGDVPVIHALVMPGELAEVEPLGNSIGLDFSPDFAATLVLARRLDPQLRRVALLCGCGKDDAAFEAIARRVLPPVAEGLDLQWLAGDLGDACRQVAQLPPHSAVLAINYNRDAAGTRYIPQEAVGRIDRASSAPVYSWTETTIGTCAVGGALCDFTAHGRAAAHLLSRLLHGETLATLGPTVAPANRLAVDHRQLDRRGLDPALLPAGVELRNQPPSILDQYRGQFLAIMLLILLQSGLITGLLWHRWHRQQAETRLEQRRRQVEHLTRVALVGGLSTSIAHELNQPLTAVQMNVEAAQILVRRLPEAPPQPDGDLPAILAEISADTLRASEVIRRLRSLLRKGATDITEVRIAEVIAEVRTLLRGELATRGIRCSTSATALPTVTGDRIQLQQVLINLMLNAAEAMAATPAGERTLVITAAGTADGMVVVAVRDNGISIPAGELERIFEPFVSTKADGMGMGLPICHGIIQAHGGRLWAVNNRDRGATFSFQLPASRRVPP